MKSRRKKSTVKVFHRRFGRHFAFCLSLFFLFLLVLLALFLLSACSLELYDLRRCRFSSFVRCVCGE